MKKITFSAALAVTIVAVSGLALAQGGINPKTGLPAEPQSPNRAPVVNLGGGSPFCSAPSVAIPDNDPTGVTDTLIIGNSFTLTDLNVSLLVTHTWVGDVAAVLDHSGGCGPLAIFDRPGVPASTFGCSGNNIDTTLDDEGGDGDVETVCLIDPAIPPGNFVPGDPPDNTLLANCDGDDINGTWTLTVTDNAGGDTGTLDQWCLVTAPVPVELMEFSID